MDIKIGLVQFFSEHPKMGTISAILLTAFGTFQPLMEMQLPIIVMQSIQVFAWLLGGMASGFTIIGWMRKNRKNSQGK